MKKFLLFIIVIVGIIVAIIIYNKVLKATPEEPSQNNGKPKEMKALGYIVFKQNLSNSIELGGTLKAMEEVDVHAEIAGRIVNININEGAQVEKGTVLVKLYDADLQAQLQKLKVQKQIAEKNESRLKELLAANGVGQQEYDAALLQLNNINADIEIVKVQIEKTEIKAPFSGKLGLKKISTGAYITQATTIVSLQQTNQLKLDFFIPEKYSSFINLGKKITFSTETSDSTQTAMVYATEPNIDENSRSLQVRALVNNNSGLLNAGAFVKVKFDLATISDALLIPSECIIPDAKSKKVILKKNGVAEFKKVVTGFRDKDKVQVLEGLNENDTIAASGIMFIKPGVKIKFIKLLNAKNSK